MAHGSALFTRGETQALVVTTLGTGQDEQVMDALEGEYRQHFMLHYNFPPYSVGEASLARKTLGEGTRGELGMGLWTGEGTVVAKSKPLTGDLLRGLVTWAEGNIADLKDQTASLRFTLRNGQFYSYWLE